MKFQIEYIAKEMRPAYLLARQLEPGNFFVSERSRLGGVAIRRFVSQPRKLTAAREPDLTVFAFTLASANDLSSLKVGQIVELDEGSAE